MKTHSSILARIIPWTEEPGKLKFMGSQRVGRDCTCIHLELPYDEAISLLGIYPKEMKTGYWRDICTPTSTAALVTTAKIQKQPHLTKADYIKMWNIYSAEY